jgi:predicted kinase
VYVVVSGPPASGKTTLSAALAHALDLPLIAKDTIKKALVGALPAADLEESRRLGGAAVAGLLAVAADNPAGAVIDSVWHRSRAVSELLGLPGQVIEVFCRCDRDVVTRRYRERTASRPPGYFDHLRTDAELWNDEVAVPVAGGWPVLEVDTSVPVQIPPLVARIRAAAGSVS